MNTRKVISLYAYNGKDKNPINCQVFTDSYWFIDGKVNGVNTSIVQSDNPMIDAKNHAKNNNLILSDKPV